MSDTQDRQPSLWDVLKQHLASLAPAPGVAHRAKLAAESLSHIPTDIVGLVGDTLVDPIADAPSVIRAGIDEIRGDQKGAQREREYREAHQGRVSHAVDAMRTAILGPEEKPQDTSEKYAAALLRGGPAGVASQAVDDTVDDSNPYKPALETAAGLAAMVVPGMVGKFAKAPKSIHVDDVIHPEDLGEADIVQGEQPPVESQAAANEKLAPAPEVPEPTPTTHKNFTEVSNTPDGTKFLNYKSKAGEDIPIKMGIEPNGIAEIAIDQFSTKANRLGPREIRSAMHDLMEMYPEIKGFGGYRRSGAGKGRVQEVTPRALESHEVSPPEASNVEDFNAARQAALTKRLYTHLTGNEPPANLSMEDMVGAAQDKFSEGGQNLTPAEMQDMDASVPADQVPHSPDYRMTSDYDKHVPYVDSETLPAQAANDPTLGAAIKGSAKRLIEDESGALRYKNEPEEEKYPDFFYKLAEGLKKAVPARKKQADMYSAERRARLNKLKQVQKVTSGPEGFYAEKAALKGEMPKADYDHLGEFLTQDDIHDMFEHVKNHPRLGYYQSIAAREGLSKMLQGQVPNKSEITLLAKTVPPELLKAILKKRTWLQKAAEIATNTLNVPKALMASYDVSAPLRQGVFMIGHKSFYTSLGPMLKAFVSPKADAAIREAIYRDPLFSTASDSGLAIPEFHGHNGGPILREKEEPFMTDYADKIPLVGIGVRAAERAFNTYVYKLRMDSFSAIYRAGRAADKVWDEKSVKDLSKFINTFTGRGDLGRFQNAAPQLNTTFFSPRLLKSRIDAINPSYYAKLDPYVRKEAIKSIMSFAVIAGTVMGLAKFGGAEIGADPRQADGWKIKVGNTRYDILGGEQQLIRLMGNISTYAVDKAKEVGKTGKIHVGFKDRTAVDNIGQFLRNKESPDISFVHDFGTGKTAVGEDFDIKKEGLDRVTPLMSQDAYDVANDLRKQGVPIDEAIVKGTIKSLPGLFGVGVQTYEKKPPKKRAKKSDDPFGDSSFDKDPFGDKDFNSDPLASQF